MKKIISVIAIMLLAVSVLAMASCSKTDFSADVASEKNMTINAVNASAGDYFITGTLKVDEGEQIAMNASLEKGEITLEFIGADGFDNIDEIPEMDSTESIYTATLSGNDAQAVGFGSGSVMVKVTATEKATGTIDVTVEAMN